MAWRDVYVLVVCRLHPSDYGIRLSGSLPSCFQGVEVNSRARRRDARGRPRSISFEKIGREGASRVVAL